MLHNASEQHWIAGSAIRLGYQVIDPDTGVLIEDSGRAELPADLAPGAEVKVEILVQLPEDDGVYLALISPVEENVAWFHDRGSDALILEAENVAETAAENAGAHADASSGVTRVIALEHTTHASRRRERTGRLIRRALIDPFRLLWQHRALIVSMVRRDINGRYRGSVGGLFWTVINPLLLMLTYFFVFGLILHSRFGPDPEHQSAGNFLVYFLAGMAPWLAINEALARAAGVVIEYRMLVKRVVFPIEILPVNVAVAGLVSEFFGLLVFLATLLFLRHSVPLTALYLPLILIPQILLTLGLSWFLSGLGVFLRDVGQFLAFFLTLVFFATPICYQEPKVTGWLSWLYKLNPVYVLVRGYRAVFLESSAPNWTSLGWLTLAGLAAFFFGFAWFYKSRKAFPDVL